MTRADKIMEYVKERYGVELSEKEIKENSFRFEACEGFDCPLGQAKHGCKTCRYYKFWEQEDDDVLSNF